MTGKLSGLYYDLAKATEVFVRAHSEVRSATYPCVPKKAEGLWIMRDTPDRKNARKIEAISPNLGPARAVQIVQEMELGWHFLCEIFPENVDPKEVRANYKALGYRAMSTEWLFVHDLKEIPEYHCEPPVREILSQEMWLTIPQVVTQRPKLREGHAKFCSWDNETDYGWVTSVPVERAAWVSGLYVFEPYRGRGFGKALMTTLLNHQREAGDEQSVLLASTDGARIYPALGYQKIATLQMYCPIKR